MKGRLYAAVTGLVVVMTVAVPASADARDVVWDGTGCVEVAAVLPDQSANGQSLVVLAYRCDEAVVDGSIFQDFAVSEISVMRGDGSTLLRQVTNNGVLHARLRSLGVADSFLGRVNFADEGMGAAPRVDVTFGQHRYSIRGVSLPNEVPPLPTVGGASYMYEGRKGTVTFRYQNHEQSFVPALFTVDASRDEPLTRWMGASTARAQGILAAGAWTGSASLSP
jgi:hypothetical protein